MLSYNKEASLGDSKKSLSFYSFLSTHLIPLIACASLYIGIANQSAYAQADAAEPTEEETAAEATPTSDATATAPKVAKLDPNDVNTGGAGDLLVAPTRIVLEGRTRASEITLSNRGSKEATYRISFTHLKMDENGKYIDLDKEGAKAGKNSSANADELIRYSPRQVTLKPDEAQTVKVMVRKPEGLADGEYVSHLLFRAVPDNTMGEDVEANKTEPGQIAIKVIPIYGVSIPIIVRQGALSAEAKLNNIKVSGKNITLTIARSGSKSVFGDLIATSSGSVVGQLQGVSVLTPNDKRHVTIPLTEQAKGPITVQYRARMEEGGKIIDEAKAL